MAFVDREPTRQVHITRILGTNRDGEVLPDIWLDVERFEVYIQATQDTKTGHYQQVTTKFRWHDDPENGDEYREEDDHGTARNTFVVKVCSPDEADLNDPEQWVPVRVIKAVHLEHGDDEGSDTNQWYRSGNPTSERTIENRRVSHYDTSIDSRAAAAFAADPTRRAYVANADAYQKDDQSKDEQQYVECEIVTAIHKQVSAHAQSNGTDQQVIKQFKNRYLLEETDPALLAELGADDKNPPYRLDPFQNIINVQLSRLEQAVLGIEDAGITTTEISNDGLDWQAGFGTSSNAASGLGHTVVCTGRKFIVFGKPRDGNSCFIAAGGFDIERGVLNEDGELVWSVVASLPSGGAEGIFGAQSCSFAGGGFFVSYLTAADATSSSYLAVSFDGDAFHLGINAFNGVSAAANGTGMAPGENSPNPIGGSVAFNKLNNRYVTTGRYERSYVALQAVEGGDPIENRFFDTNFMSSVSSNGTSWTAAFDTSECSGFPPPASAGIGAMQDRAAPTVTFGNGRLVSSSSVKVNYDFYESPSFVIFKLTAYIAAVATSLDGAIWTNHRLPDSISTGWTFGDATANSGGYGAAVKFFASKTNASGVPGFFVATASEYGGTAGVPGKLWQSEDGIAWTLVRTADEFDWILSAINKSRGTIVIRD